MLLRELTELDGVSGNEKEVCSFIINHIREYADDYRIDRMGNLIVYKKGRNPKFRLMLSAHMDEVGFMVVGHDGSGNLKFKNIGGMDERILLGQRVRVGSNKIPGVIGSKPFHLQDKAVRSENIKLKEMVIDIGAQNRDEAEKAVHVGEYAAFISPYQELGEHCIKAKTLDDRVGCSILMEMLKEQFDFDLYACFTVQEEVGLRGSQTAAYRVKPDIGLVIEGTTCSDVPGVLKQDYSTVLGAGAAVTIMDRTAYNDRSLVGFIYETARSSRIPVQYKQTTTGGNDAGSIQRSRAGVRVASLSVPCRYIHSPVSVIDRRDLESCRNLVLAVLKRLDGEEQSVSKFLNGGRLNA